MISKKIRPSVLVVDDEPLVLILTMDMVDELGFRAVPAPNADAAIQYLERHEEVAVLLTDIEMPGFMNGVGLAHAVRHRWPSVGLILTSARPPETVGFIPEGADFIQKPYKLETLAGHVRRAFH